MYSLIKIFNLTRVTLQRFICPGVALCFCVMLSQTALAQSRESGKPNIVIIMADDLATNELSCYGGKNINTPHIDALDAV